MEAGKRVRHLAGKAVGVEEPPGLGHKLRDVRRKGLRHGEQKAAFRRVVFDGDPTRFAPDGAGAGVTAPVHRLHAPDGTEREEIHQQVMPVGRAVSQHDCEGFRVPFGPQLADVQAIGFLEVMREGRPVRIAAGARDHVGIKAGLGEQGFGQEAPSGLLVLPGRGAVRKREAGAHVDAGRYAQVERVAGAFEAIGRGQVLLDQRRERRGRIVRHHGQPGRAFGAAAQARPKACGLSGGRAGEHGQVLGIDVRGAGGSAVDAGGGAAEVPYAVERRCAFEVAQAIELFDRQGALHGGPSLRRACAVAAGSLQERMFVHEAVYAKTWRMAQEKGARKGRKGRPGGTRRRSGRRARQKGKAEGQGKMPVRLRGIWYAMQSRCWASRGRDPKDP